MYRYLARHIDKRFSIYGLQSSYLGGSYRLLNTVAEMSALYLKELRTVQPQGPYLIAGYCGGCPIALEISQQLRADNQTVALLALFDPAPIRTYQTPHVEGYSRSAKAKLQSFYTRIQQQGLRAIAKNQLLKSTAWFYDQWQMPLPLALRVVQVQSANMQSLRSYIAQKPYYGKVAMYLPEQGITPKGEIPQGWDAIIASDFLTRSVPGKHYHDGASAGSFLSEPAVRTLADSLNEHLTQALLPQSKTAECDRLKST